VAILPRLGKTAGVFVRFLAPQSSGGSSIAAKHLYPSRLEGRTNPYILAVREFRARLGPDTTAPQYVYGRSCSAVLSAIKSAPSNTPLVSLQRFYDEITKENYYQAVWPAPMKPHGARVFKALDVRIWPRVRLVYAPVRNKQFSCHNF